MNTLYCPLDSSGTLDLDGIKPNRTMRMPLWLTLPGGEEFNMMLLLVEVPLPYGVRDLNEPVKPVSQNLLHFLGAYWRPEIS